MHWLQNSVRMRNYEGILYDDETLRD